ncbi:S24 family peptidase [Oxalobacter paraformigenes]|uniref:HTH cro/C1-type domain-containing protein n=1 Tax=Oxalobacter paraformigenes TaxID=556268 RepID=C3X398_9BURK|nr:S24 family peptidase [Oxalobacter paraformigenes]EEO27684.1 hypothetical protein OFAG_00837 [Oxalobacter paraformigenes]
MEFWNERLSKALIARSKKPVDLVKATGKSAASISGWLNGQTKMIEADNAMLVCAFLRISPWWLMFGKGKSGLEEELPTFAEQAVAIRNPDEEAVFDVLDVVAVCGPGRINPDYPEIIRSIVMPITEAYNLIGTRNTQGQIKIITAGNDSMVPTIKPSDILFVDTSVTQYSGEAVYILVHGGELICKRLSLLGKDLIVSSDNKFYGSWNWKDKPDDTQIVGKVIRALPMDFKVFAK